jgi:hypothetical protein
MSDETDDELKQDQDREEREREGLEPSSNAGKLGIGLDGHLTEGLGGGLGIDLKDGGLEMQIAPGVSIDI